MAEGVRARSWPPRPLLRRLVYEGLEAQAFPFFGAERRGAPVMAFCRIDDKKISVRTQVYQPDMLVVMDESLLEIEPVAGRPEEGRLRGRQHQAVA